MLTIYISYTLGALGEDNEIYLSNIESARADFKEKQSYLNALQFNYDGTLIITGGSDGVVRVWKVSTYKYFSEIRSRENFLKVWIGIQI